MPTHFDFLARLRADWPALKRSTRLADRVAQLNLKRLAEARRDDIAPAGGACADAPARTPRRAPATKAAKQADSGDSDGDGPARAYSISAVSHAGITVHSTDGRPATLAVIDADGNVLADDVAREAWVVAVHAYRQFLQGNGHLRVHSSPPGIASA